MSTLICSMFYRFFLDNQHDADLMMQVRLATMADTTDTVPTIEQAVRKYREHMDSRGIEMAVIVRLRPELTFMVTDYNRANRTELRREHRSTNIYTISSTGQKYSTSTEMTVNPDTCIHLKKTLCSTNRAHYELYL